MKYAIIGYGKMGQIRHDSMRRIGMGDAAKIYEENDMDEFQNIRSHSIPEIFEDKDIDAVIICAPNYLNKTLTIEAMKSGKHVFCEKPPGFNGVDVEEIIHVEKETGRVLHYGFNHRFHGGTRKLKEFVDSNEFGKVLWIRGRYGKSVDEGYFNTWRAKPELAGGGILIDQGIHMIDLFLQISGDFDEIHAFVSSLYWNLPGIEDNVFAIFRNSETGQCASLHSTMTQWRHLFSFEVFLERGYLVLNGLKTPSGTYGVEKLSVARNRSVAPAATWEDEEVFQFDADTSWEEEMRNFCTAVRDGIVDYSSSSSALDVMRMIDRIYENDHHRNSVLYSKLNP